MSVALLTAVSCSQTETDIFPAGGGDAGTTAALGVTASVNGGTDTKAVVDYKKIIYPGGVYADAPGLGVVLTDANATAWYNDAISNYGGHHIWFMGDQDGSNWISIKNGKGTSYGDNKKDYNLSTEVGRVYAYYPYNASITLPTGTFTEDDLKLPVSVKTTGTIDATTSNADKVWNGAAWTDKTDNHLISLADAGEIDYMYFDGKNAAGTETGRYVNNGHAGNAVSANNNMNTTNPGYSISLTMKHALSMVSFRVYDGGNLGTAGKVELVNFKIEDQAGASLLNVAGGTMKLADGTLAFATTTAGSIARTVSNYVLVQQIATGADSENTFIENTAGGVTGAAVSKIVSAMVYPTDFSAGSLKLTVTLSDKAQTPAKETEYSVNIPGRNWEKNKNYLYTLSAGRNKLNIVQVDVQEWTVQDAGELPL